MPLDLPPIPTPPTEAERRATALDPRTLALLLSGAPGLRESGRGLMENQLARERFGVERSGQAFTQRLQGAQEKREQERTKLMQEQIEMSRWQPVQGVDGITYLVDMKTHRVLPGIVPGQGWRAGPPPSFGDEGPTPGPAPTPAPAPTQPLPSHVPSGQPDNLGVFQPPGGLPRPRSSAQVGAAPGAVPGEQPAPSGGPAAIHGLDPAAQAYVEMSLRKHMPPEAVKELDAAERTRVAIQQGLAAVSSRPQAFAAQQSAEEWLPTDFLRSYGRQFHGRTRDPQDTMARQAVFAYTVGAMHDYFGARMTEPEFQRSSMFLPLPTDDNRNIAAKLTQALQTLDRYDQRVRRTYMPMLPDRPSTSTPQPQAPQVAAPQLPQAPQLPGPGGTGRRIPVTRGGQTRYWLPDENRWE